MAFFASILYHPFFRLLALIGIWRLKFAERGTQSNLGTQLLLYQLIFILFMVYRPWWSKLILLSLSSSKKKNMFSKFGTWFGFLHSGIVEENKASSMFLLSGWVIEFFIPINSITKQEVMPIKSQDGIFLVILFLNFGNWMNYVRDELPK